MGKQRKGDARVKREKEDADSEVSSEDEPDKEEEEGSGREPERNARERGSRDVCGHRTVIPNRSLVGRVLPI